jgi:hypothetical protein
MQAYGGVWLPMERRRSIYWLIGEHDPHAFAGRHDGICGSERGHLEWAARSFRFHVGIVPLAKGKAHSKLRIELREFVHANELVFASSTGPHIERDAELMV